MSYLWPTRRFGDFYFTHEMCLNVEGQLAKKNIEISAHLSIMIKKIISTASTRSSSLGL